MSILFEILQKGLAHPRSIPLVLLLYNGWRCHCAQASCVESTTLLSCYAQKASLYTVIVENVVAKIVVVCSKLREATRTFFNVVTQTTASATPQQRSPQHLTEANRESMPCNRSPQPRRACRTR